jgi:hypothetical protein
MGSGSLLLVLRMSVFSASVRQLYHAYGALQLSHLE